MCKYQSIHLGHLALNAPVPLVLFHLGELKKLFGGLHLTRTWFQVCVEHRSYIDKCVTGWSKIQTLSHMTQVLLKLRFSCSNGKVIKVGFLHLQMFRYITIL